MTRHASGWAAMGVASMFWLTGCESQGPQGGVMGHRTHTAMATAETIPIADASEVDMVEQLAYHRQSYEQYLRALIQYYNDHGYRHKAIWAERELKDVSKVKTYRYLVDAELPGPRMRPKDSIAEADALYDDGLHYMKEGGHGIPLYYNADKMKLALEKFNEIIQRFPTSDKIDDAAFMAGEIYKEYFNDDHRALVYYQRAYEWDPQTPHPARFQAAVVYDYRLHDRDKALELYNEVIEKETTNRSNYRFSVRRIKQLTEDDDAATPEEPDYLTSEEQPEEEPEASTASYPG